MLKSQGSVSDGSGLQCHWFKPATRGGSRPSLYGLHSPVFPSSGFSSPTTEEDAQIQAAEANASLYLSISRKFP